MARIATGALKGLTLTIPQHIRATEDKVRQALFNIVGSHVEGANVLDGFAGSGALGLEALSRGADRVVFLESHPECLRAIRANVAKLSPEAMVGIWEIVQGDVLSRLPAVAQRFGVFDLVLLDPPYDGPWGKKALHVVAACGILAPAGLVCLEHARQSQISQAVGPLKRMTQHRYGDTVLSFYQLAGST